MKITINKGDTTVIIDGFDPPIAREPLDAPDAKLVTAISELISKVLAFITKPC